MGQLAKPLKKHLNNETLLKKVDVPDNPISAIRGMKPEKLGQLRRIQATKILWTLIFS